MGQMMHTFVSAAEEELVDVFSLEKFLIRNPQSSFIIKVSGNSMSSAGIMPGDLVILDRVRKPASGDIVIAEVDGQHLMRFFQKDGPIITLIPANSSLKAITPEEELKISGVVTSVVRKYH